MKIYDITQELFTASVYPGAPRPALTTLASLDRGDDYTLSQFSAGCHNGTHMDAPLHVVPEGASIAEVPVSALIGPCSVVEMEGIITGADIDGLLPRCNSKLLFRTKGRAVLTPSAAFAMAEGGVTLFGIDAMRLAEEKDERTVHRYLLEAGIPILEGVDLSGVPAGGYTLIALPMKLQGAEASPVRAILIAGRW